jgi:hypothetical protein
MFTQVMRNLDRGRSGRRNPNQYAVLTIYIKERAY